LIFAIKSPVKVSTHTLFAYIDPGSGLLIWQVIVAACIGGLFYLKKIRKYLGKICRKILGRAEEPEVKTTQQP
jgi:hypothetical protein